MTMNTSAAQQPVEPGFIQSYMNVTPAKYCLLWFVTLGFYSFYFQIKLSKLMTGLKMEGDVAKLIPFARYNLYLRLFYIFGGMALLLMGLDSLFNLSRLLILAAIVIEVMWSFKARNILSLYVADKYKVLVNANGLMMFFFPGLSLTMMFNSIENEIALLKALRKQ